METGGRKKTGTAMLALTFENRQGRLRIFKSVIAALGKPEYIRLLISKEDRAVAVQESSARDRDAISVLEKIREGSTGFYVNSRALVEAVSDIMSWSQKKNYRVDGRMSEDGIIVFLLDEARELS